MLKKWLHSVFIVVLFLGVGQSVAFEKQAIGTELVNAWKVLEDAGIKTKSIDDVKYVDDYLKKNPKAKVADEIADAGGVGNWKSVARMGIQLTKARFGHTFVKHGEDATTFLINRAKGSGQIQGQFLNNQKAAQFILDNVGKTANGAVNVPIHKGFPARVIMPNGTFRNATHIRLVPGGNGVKTAYPLISGL